MTVLLRSSRIRTPRATRGAIALLGAGFLALAITLGPMEAGGRAASQPPHFAAWLCPAALRADHELSGAECRALVSAHNASPTRHAPTREQASRC